MEATFADCGVCNFYDFCTPILGWPENHSVWCIGRFMGHSFKFEIASGGGGVGGNVCTRMALVGGRT